MTLPVYLAMPICQEITVVKLNFNSNQSALMKPYNNSDDYSDLILTTPPISPQPLKKNAKPKAINKKKTIRKQKISAACYSCQRLKIKCDKIRPKCEYCAYRGKKCEYADGAAEGAAALLSPASSSLSSPAYSSISSSPAYSSISSPESSSSIFEIQRASDDALSSNRSINSSTHLLNISRQDLQLLNFYNQCSPMLFGCKPGSDAANVWQCVVPGLWSQSKVIRECMYLTSSISQWFLYDDLDKIREVTIAEEEGGRGGGGEDQKNTTLVDVTLKHIETASMMMLDFFQIFKNGQGHQRINPVECLILVYTMFTALCQHPYKLVPLYVEPGTGLGQGKGAGADNAANPHGGNNTPVIDLITVIANFKKMNSTLVFSNISSILDVYPLLYMEERILPTEELNYRLITPLRRKLEAVAAAQTATAAAAPGLELEELDVLDVLLNGPSSATLTATAVPAPAPDLKELIDQVIMLEIVIYRCITFSYPVPLFRSIFNFSNRFFEILKEPSSINRYYRLIALKILFIFSSLSLIFNFRIFKKSNVWIEFIEYYKNKIHKGQFNWDEIDIEMMNDLDYYTIKENKVPSIDKFFGISGQSTTHQ